MEHLNLLNRTRKILVEDLDKRQDDIRSIVERSKFLVIGGAGSIGQAVVTEIFKRNPKTLHVIDVSENNLVELIRDLRSSLGYVPGDFQTFALDTGSEHFLHWLENTDKYDFVLNLSALKHVRSEKDAYTLMRMIDTNIMNVVSCMKILIEKGTKKYFVVSTDKAANPANLMGASKYIMERALLNESHLINFSSARFANVAFSDGSLLHGFDMRLKKRQPISAPNDVRRYFITAEEAGQICLLSCLFGQNREVFFPKLSDKLHQITFSNIAIRYLQSKGLVPHECETEDEARNFFSLPCTSNKWPCYFFNSDTTGEKDFEEFHTETELVELGQYNDLGVIKNLGHQHDPRVNDFLSQINEMQKRREYNRDVIIDLFKRTVETLEHIETGKFLDDKM